MENKLDPQLLSVDSIAGQDISFPATFRARGEYMPLTYVLRLSPAVHRVLSTSPQDGIYSSSEIGFDRAQAFSTYLHETVHWWQHIGSTYGLMSSLSYPTRAHANHGSIKKLISLGELKKSVLQMASMATEEPSTPETISGLANIIVNNHFDLNVFSRFAYNQEFAMASASSNMFESLGHAIRMTIGLNLLTMATVVDRDCAFLPDPRSWSEAFKELREKKVEGFYYGSRVGIWPIGTREILEGLACFSQMQYLHFASGGQFEWDVFRNIGILHGVYESAFKEFLLQTEIGWPTSINDPAVALFMLICDMAINPGAGFPFDPSPKFENIIDDTLPGIRFTAMSRKIRLEFPHLLRAITNYSRAEYEAVSEQISAAMWVPSPLQISARCEKWATGAMSNLMEEYRTYDYKPINHVVRVLLSHFLAFNQDKLVVPEIFCWPGAWMSGDNVSQRVADVFERHGAMFVDRETDSGIYPRMRKGYDESAVQRMFDDFYAATVIYELTDQLIVKPGPFAYKYDWLNPSATPAEFKQFADRHFNAAYGLAPDEIEVF
jgi:hypothetical protein